MVVFYRVFLQNKSAAQNENLFTKQKKCVWKLIFLFKIKCHTYSTHVYTDILENMLIVSLAKDFSTTLNIKIV